jgi:hypothetical protein
LAFGLNGAPVLSSAQRPGPYAAVIHRPLTHSANTRRGWSSWGRPSQDAFDEARRFSRTRSATD